MSGLTLSMLHSLSAPICSVFDSNIKRIIRSGSHEEFPLLRHIISQTVVPDDAFKWLAQSKQTNIDIISYLIKQRLSWDKKLDAILKVLESSEEEFYSCTQIDNMLEANRI